VLPLHCTFSLDAIKWRQSLQSIGASLTSLLSAFFCIFLIPEYFFPQYFLPLRYTFYSPLKQCPPKVLLPFVTGVFLINKFRYKFCGINIIFFNCFFPRHIALNSFDTRTTVWSTSSTAVLCYLTVVRSLVEWYLFRIVAGESLQKFNQFPGLLCFFEYFIPFCMLDSSTENCHLSFVMS